MGFTKNDLGSIEEQIFNDVLNGKTTMTIQEFKKHMVNFRIKSTDANNILNRYKTLGYISRSGKIIYILQERKAGRPNKLTEEEKEIIKTIYKPFEFGYRKVAEIINKKRIDDEAEIIHPNTIYNECHVAHIHA